MSSFLFKYELYLKTVLFVICYNSVVFYKMEVHRFFFMALFRQLCKYFLIGNDLILVNLTEAFIVHLDIVYFRLFQEKLRKFHTWVDVSSWLRSMLSAAAHTEIRHVWLPIMCCLAWEKYGRWLVGQEVRTQESIEGAAADYLLQHDSLWLIFKVLPNSLFQ